MAAASEVAALLGPPGADLRVEPSGHRCGDGTHSTVGDGRRVCWRPRTPLRAAVDAEIARSVVPAALARRWGSDPDVVWPAWCAAEVVAKLTDVPVLLLVRAGPPVSPGRSAGWSVPVDAGEVVGTVGRVGDLHVVRGVLVPRR